MRTLELPINIGSEKDTEDIGYDTNGIASVDVYTDNNDNIVRRPGLELFCDLESSGAIVSAGVDSLYWWDRQEKVICVCGGKAFEITSSAGTNSEISGDTFQVDKNVYWADFGTSLYGANGGRIVKIPSSGDMAYISNAVAPTTCSHISVIDDILLALETGTERVHYSDTSDPDTWSGNWVSAVTDPDLLKAIGVAQDRIELLGTKVLEGWRNDGATPFVKDNQYTIDIGTAAAHSFVFLQNNWYFIDQDRKIVRLDGRTPQDISLTLNKYVQGFDVVSDAIGTHTMFAGRPQLIFIFPTEDKTISIDIYGNKWSELCRWNSTKSSYERFLGKSFCVAHKWNLALVGDRLTGRVYKLNTSNYQDNSSTLRSMIRTRHIDWGYPGHWKHSSRLDFHLKNETVLETSDDVYMIVRWRDQGRTGWDGERVVSLGRSNSTDFHGKLTRMGRYKTRQYEFILSDNCPMAIVRVLETFDIKGVQS